MAGTTPTSTTAVGCVDGGRERAGEANDSCRQLLRRSARSGKVSGSGPGVGDYRDRQLRRAGGVVAWAAGGSGGAKVPLLGAGSASDLGPHVSRAGQHRP